MHQKISQDISESSDHSLNRLLSLAKAVAIWIGTHPLYISYLVFFSPYILKLLCFLSPLLILLLATTLCAFSTTASTSNSFFRVKCNETQENACTTILEAEAYKIIFDTFHDSVTSLADECDEVEAYKQIKLEALAPEVVKSLCSYTPQHDHDPALHEIVAKTAICAGDKVLNQAGELEDEKSIICDETEIIKHMVCSTINEQDEHESDDDDEEEEEEEDKVKVAVEVKINKAEGIPLTTTPESGSKASPIESVTSTDLHKTSNLSSIGSMRMEKEWTRTLACKLFEERHNSRGGGGGEDGMDMLWETFDESSSSSSSIVSPPPQRMMISRRSSRSGKSIRVCADDVDDDVDGDDVDDDMASGKMCCLQALKMSSGKVNLGIKSKNMIKFSKALRGFGWLHKTTRK